MPYVPMLGPIVALVAWSTVMMIWPYVEATVPALKQSKQQKVSHGTELR